MQKLRAAFIGFGETAELTHWPAYAASAEVEIVAVVDPSESRQHAAKKLKNDVRTYSTFEALAAHETLDFVDICSPPTTHVKLAQESVRKGWHVLCEKPLSLASGDYQLLAKHVQREQKSVFTVHRWKYATAYLKALELIHKNRIGAVWHVELFTLRNARSATATGGGVLVDQGWHSFYLLLNLMNAEPERALAKMLINKEHATPLEEAVQAIIQFPNGNGYIHLTWKAQMNRNSAVIHGQTGTILVDDDRLLLTGHDGKQEEIPFKTALSAPGQHADWFARLLPDFLSEVRNPAQRGKNFREAGWCVALTCASYESNLRGFQEVPVVFPGAPKPTASLVSASI